MSTKQLSKDFIDAIADFPEEIPAIGYGVNAARSEAAWRAKQR